MSGRIPSRPSRWLTASPQMPSAGWATLVSRSWSDLLALAGRVEGGAGKQPARPALADLQVVPQLGEGHEAARRAPRGAGCPGRETGTPQCGAGAPADGRTAGGWISPAAGSCSPASARSSSAGVRRGPGPPPRPGPARRRPRRPGRPGPPAAAVSGRPAGPPRPRARREALHGLVGGRAVGAPEAEQFGGPSLRRAGAAGCRRARPGRYGSSCRRTRTR